MPLDPSIDVIGSRVIIKPVKQEKTHGGIILPGNVAERVGVGFVVKVGPGFMIPDFKQVSLDEWAKQQEDTAKYLPLQVKVGDFVIYMLEPAIEVKIDGEDYVILQHDAILTRKKI
ncbi:MAG: hypothetical protein Q7R33_01005 [Nitrosarchaeum sp.]|nr:hypothetical protein [Nitrosarchaeum sp.]